MAARQHLVLEEGQSDKPGMGRATALQDMTKCFEQIRLWHVWRWGCHWGFPLLRIILVVFSFLRRVGLWGSVSQPVTTRFGLLLCHPSHVVHLALRLSDEQVASTAIDEVRGRSHDQLQRNEPCSRYGNHRGSELDGGLAGLDFHVSKDEEGVEGKSVVLVSNASLKWH